MQVTKSLTLTTNNGDVWVRDPDGWSLVGGSNESIYSGDMACVLIDELVAVLDSNA